MREHDKELEKVKCELEKQAIIERKKILEGIKFLEKLKGISRGDLENFMGLGRGEISRMANNKREFILTELGCLSNKLQVSIDELKSNEFYNKKSEEYIKACLEKIKSDTKIGRISWTKGTDFDFITNEDIAEAYIEDLVNRCCAKENGNPRKLVTYYRGKCQDNREFLLTTSVSSMSKNDKTWDLSILKWRCDVDYQNEEYYSLDKIIVIYELLGKSRDELLSKNLELVEVIERCLKDTYISVEAMKEIDLICGV